MSEIPWQEKIVDDVRFELRAMPTMKAIRLKARILKMLGPAAVHGIETTTSGVQDYAKVASLLLENLTEDELESVLREFFWATNAEIDGKQVPLFSGNGKVNAGCFDTLFAGRTEAVWQLVVFAVETNYRGFFSWAKSQYELLARAGAAQKTAALAALSKSPKTSATSGSVTG